MTRNRHRMTRLARHVLHAAVALEVGILLGLVLPLPWNCGEAQAAETRGEIEAQARGEAGFPSGEARARRISRGSVNWWGSDVWSDPDRPFLYYGEEPAPDILPGRKAAPPPPPEEKPEEEKAPEKEPDPDDFSRFQTAKELRAEYERRLDRAVMNPTAENVIAFQAVNAYMLGLSHAFAQAFDRARIAEPRYDWTATHPTANFATADLKFSAGQSVDAFVSEIAREAGLLFVGGSEKEKNELASGPIGSLARNHGFEVLAVETGAELTHMRGLAENGQAVKVKADNGIAAKVTDPKDPLSRPALLLIPKPTATHPGLKALGGRPLLVSTGIAATQELKRRIALLFSPALKPKDRAVPGFREPAGSGASLLPAPAVPVRHGPPQSFPSGEIESVVPQEIGSFR